MLYVWHAKHTLTRENSNMRVISLAITMLILPLSSLYADNVKTDSTSEANSAIFLNASSDSKPREVSFGLPTNTSSAIQIFEDGLPVSYYIYHLFPYKSWHGGVSASRTGTIGPMETAMRYGEINNYADSYNILGSDILGGKVNYTYGIYGQHKLDVNLSGHIAGGVQFSASTYQNFDPGSNHIDYPFYKDRHQFYKCALSKDFGKAKVSVVYQYVNFLYVQENYGPFVFVGDGSVKPYNGFDLGRDCYLPSFNEVSYMNFKTGKMESMGLKDGNTDKSNHLTFNLEYTFSDDARLVFRSRLKDGTSVRGSGTLAGIDNATAETGYTYADGSAYAGPVQKRNLLHFDTFESSWINNAELSLKKDHHDLRIGIDFNLNKGGTVSSSAIFAHEVASDPEFLLFNGERFYNFNTGAEYYNGHETKFAGYIKDCWKVGPRLDINAFARAESLDISGKSANNIGDDKSNTRYSGFNLTKGKITPFGETYLNGSFGAEGLYKIVGGLFVQGDFTFTRIHSNIFNYGGFYDPSTDPTDTYLARFGLSFQNKWISILSQVNYISQSNYNTRSVFQHTLQKESAGYPAGFTESVTLPLTYGISSLGWVTDAMITPAKGINIHMSLTVRNPKYKDFEFAPTFSDGVTDVHDFSGKNVTNLHKVEIVCDPSYTIGDWRLWLSARYISKTYVNKTNSLYFKGRVETFGGIDYKIKEKIKLSLNVINILNQKGASGNISSADLVEDASGYKDFLMAGTFIRPFTVELGMSIGF